jgi:hypothetical protein
MNISDLINDFLVEVREHGGFANDKNFDRVAAEVFKMKVREVIEECAQICDPPDRLNDLLKTVLRDRAAAIRAMLAEPESAMPLLTFSSPCKCGHVMSDHASYRDGEEYGGCLNLHCGCREFHFRIRSIEIHNPSEEKA